jgi:hypothetical protein
VTAQNSGAIKWVSTYPTDRAAQHTVSPRVLHQVGAIVRTICASQADEGVQSRRSRVGSYESQHCAPLAAEYSSPATVRQATALLVGRLHHEAIAAERAKSYWRAVTGAPEALPVNIAWTMTTVASSAHYLSRHASSLAASFGGT